MALRIILFLIINFAALGIGSFFTNSGVDSGWYQSLNKAPWTPPGWVFGAAWSTIMICFAVYMSFAWEKVKNRRGLITLFVFQWLLNVVWNPLFFYLHHVKGGLIVIILLTTLVALFFFRYWHDLKTKSLLVLPYLIWLIIATSLNWYILNNN